MNMTLSKRGDYVVRSALCLARAAAEGESRKIREVVAEMDVPQTFASQILADLVRARLALSKAGKDGGYRLARPASEITLLEVVEAGDGRLRSERCALGDGPCRWEWVCPLHETWTAATAAMRDVLAKTTLQEVLEQDEALELGSARAPSDSHRIGMVVVPSWGVSDSVQVERVQSEVLRLLGDEALLAGTVAQAYGAAEVLRAELDPVGKPWGGGPAKSQAATSVTRAEERESAKGVAGETEPADVANFRRVAWDVAHPDGSSSRLEGAFSVVAVDAERSDLHLEGRFRPPASFVETANTNRAVADRVVQALVRSFLRQLARSMEEETTSAPV